MTRTGGSRTLDLTVKYLTLLIGLLCCLPTGGLRASERSGQTGDFIEVDREPQVQLETLAGDVREVPLAEFRVEDARQLDVVFVRYRGLPEPAPLATDPEDQVEVLSTEHGDVLMGALRSGDGDRIELEIVGGALVTLSIEDVAGLIFRQRLPFDGDVAVVAAVEGDRLFRRRGAGVDRIDGLFQSFESDGVRFEGGLGERLYPWSEVAALFIEDLEGDAEPASDVGLPIVVDLRGQSRLHGRLLSMDGNGCHVATGGNPDLFLPAAAISEIAVDDGSYRFLSALTPSDLGPVSPTGDDLGMVWPPRMDRARTGAALSAGGRTWARGIGVQAPSRIVWDLGSEWQTLRGQVAIDDSVLALPRRGSVVFRVLVDGEKRYESPIMRGGDPPLDLGRVDLTGARELVLEVDPSTDLWMADRADWLRPILVRRP
ncbi:MAG: hypothetical protein ACI8QZ_004088 [Chlamydiales bacterium]